MPVNNVSNVSQTYGGTAAQKTSENSAYSSLGSAQFMQILMAQLTHQNPLEPMKDSEMMSQFAQLNSVQELKDIHAVIEKLSTSNQTAYAASLIGKVVKISRPDGTSLEGVVDGVSSEKDSPQLRIGNESAALSSVVEIKGE